MLPVSLCAIALLLLTVPSGYLPAQASDYELGMRAYQAADYEVARQHLQKALANSTQQPYVLYYLADSLVRLNRLEDARPFYIRLLALAPDSQAGRLARLQLERFRQLEASRYSSTGTGGPSGGGLALGQDVLFGLNSEGVNYLEKVSYSGKLVRWSLLKMPLRLYIERAPRGLKYFDSQYITRVGEALRPWTKALGNQLSYILVWQPDEADIVVRFSNGVDNAGVKTDTGTVYTAGITVPEIQNDRLKQMIVTLATQDIKGRPLKSEDLYHIAVHEFGHALGLLGHSDNPNDIMYAEAGSSEDEKDAQKRLLSDGDVNTIRRLYSVSANISNLDANTEQKQSPEALLDELAAIEKEILKREDEVTKRGTSFNLTNLANAYLEKAKLLETYENRSNTDAPEPAKASVDKALKTIDKAITTDATNATAFQTRSVIHEVLGKLPESYQDITQAIRLAPNDPKLYLQQAWILAKLGKTVDAKNSLNAYITRVPNGQDDPFFKQIIDKLRR